MAAGAIVIAVLYNVAILVGLYIFSRRSSSRRWHIPLRSTNRLAKPLDGAPPNHFPAWRWHDPSDLYTSHDSDPKPSIFLLLYRIFILAVFLFVIFFQEYSDSSLAFDFRPEDLTEFTNWTFIVMALHSLLGIAISLRGFKRAPAMPSRDARSDKYDLKGYDLLDQAFAVVSTTVITSALFLTVVYWAFVNDGTKLYLDSPFKHGVNVVLLLGELLVSKTPFTSTWMVFPLAYAVAYGIFMCIYWGASGTWSYEMLDLTAWGNIGYYFALPWAVLLAFWIIYAWVALREWIASKVKPHRGGGDAVSTQHTSAEPSRQESAATSSDGLELTSAVRCRTMPNLDGPLPPSTTGFGSGVIRGDRGEQVHTGGRSYGVSELGHKAAGSGTLRP